MLPKNLSSMVTRTVLLFALLVWLATAMPIRADVHTPEWVHDRVIAIQPTREERRIDEIVYILKPDGHALNGSDIGSATDTRKMIARLEEDARILHVALGAPVVMSRSVSVSPKAAPDALVLHLTSRADGTGPAGGSWHEFPSENWIVFDRAEWMKLVPGGTPRLGATYEVSRQPAAKLVVYFYPQTEQTEDNSIDRNRIDSMRLQATVVAISGSIVRARLDATLRMKHTLYPGKDDGNFVDATAQGYLEVERRGSRPPTLELVTDRATYGSTGFGVAVRSVP